MKNKSAVNDFLVTSKELASEYDGLTEEQLSTNEAILRTQVDIAYRKKHNGKSWREKAIDKLLETELLEINGQDNKTEIAGYISETIENKVSHVKSLEFASRRFKNNPNVDSQRLTNEAVAEKNTFDDDVLGALHDSSIINLASKNNIIPEVGEAKTTYSMKYYEQDDMSRTPSSLKYEPEDLVDGFRFIEGYHEFASMKDIVTDQALHQNHIPPMFARYLAEKGEETGSSFMVMSKDKVEDFLIADSKDAKLDVSKNKAVVEVEDAKTDEEQEFENRKQEKHTLAVVALELATSKPETSISRFKESSSELKTVCEDMKQTGKVYPDTQVQHVQKYVHSRADKLGVLKNIKSLEKSVRFEKQQMLNQLKGRRRQQIAKKVEGGRKIGESRPGANKRLGHS